MTIPLHGQLISVLFSNCFFSFSHPCRDLLQTLTEEELHTLERNLCISQDMEFPVRSDPEVPTAISPVLIAALPSEEPLSSKTENTEVELACSMQYDEQELEQLNMMVHRVGDEMSSLLSPPSVCQSPAHRASSSTEASPSRRPRDQLDDEDRVFFMDDLDGALDGLSRRRISENTSSWVNNSCYKPKQTSLCQDTLVQNGDMDHIDPLKETESDISNNNNVDGTKILMSSATLQNSCSCLEMTDSQVYLNGWDVNGDDAETAEMIATRTGGMKISATVIFNPKSCATSASLETSPDLACSHSPLSSDPLTSLEGDEAHKLTLAATNCLINSCVCCGSCDDTREDSLESLTTVRSPGKVINASYSLIKSKEIGHLDRRECAVSAKEVLIETPPVLLLEKDRQEQRHSNSSKCLAHTSGSQIGMDSDSEEAVGASSQHLKGVLKRKDRDENNRQTRHTEEVCLDATSKGDITSTR